MRTNIVGTHCVCVTRCRSISASASAASKCSMITTVPPRRCTFTENAQRRGVVHRRGRQVDRVLAPAVDDLAAEDGRVRIARRVARQRPLHALRPAGGARRVEHRRAHRSRRRAARPTSPRARPRRLSKPGIVPSTIRRTLHVGHVVLAARPPAISAFAADVTSTLRLAVVQRCTRPRRDGEVAVDRRDVEAGAQRSPDAPRGTAAGSP